MKTPSDVALEKVTYNLETSNALLDAIRRKKPENKNELHVLAIRLRLCASPENQYIASDLHDEKDGNLFDGFGRFWRCGSKLCAFCLAHQTRRNRKKLTELISKTKLQLGTNFQFITLTFPTQKVSLMEAREITNYAWSLFRKRKYIMERLLTGAKSEEFTLNSTGYHYHLHVLAVTRWLDYQIVRTIWTECINAAFEQKGLDLIIKTSDELLDVKIKRVYDKKKVVFEIAKYICKNDSWKKIPASDLIDIATIRRFPRMFEIFGNWKQPKQDTILDKSCISDGKGFDASTSYWRDVVNSCGIKRYYERLTAEFNNAIIHRSRQLKLHYPFATFSPLPTI